MCGRFIVSYTYEELALFLSESFNIFDFHTTNEYPNYNVAPSSNVLSVIYDGSNYRAGDLRWGFIPTPVQDKKSGLQLINSRVETIDKKRVFRESLLHRRCLILSNGYYEWKNIDNGKQPYLIKRPNNDLFLFAGIYNRTIVNGKDVFTTAIVTKPATATLSDIHDRMPVILDLDSAKEWLSNDMEIIAELKRDLHNEIDIELEKVRVSDFVNNVKNNSEKCVQPFQDEHIL